MTPEFLLVLVISVFTLAVLVAGILFLNRGRMKTLFVALHILFLIVNISCLVGRQLHENGLDILTLSSTVMVFPVIAILVLAFFHGRSFTERIYLPIMIFLPSLGIVYVSVVEAWTSSDLYDHSVFIYYIVFCLAISFAESTAVWLRSSILRKEGYLLVLTLIILLATGPIYYQELRILSADDFIGPNLGFPLSGVAILIALLRTDCPPVNIKTKRRTRENALRFLPEPGRLHFVSEARPKYSRSIFADELDNGKAGLVLASSRMRQSAFKSRIGNAASIEISFTNGKDSIRAWDLGRVYYCIRDFAAAHSNGVVLVDAFPLLVCNNDTSSARELVSSMRRIARRTDCTFLVPLSLLTNTESSRLVVSGDSLMEFPDVETRVLEILEAHIGNLSRHLLRRYCRSKGIGIKDLLLEDVPDLAVWITSALDTLGVHAGDGAMLRNWKNESYATSQDLMRFHNSDIEEAQRLQADPPVTVESLIPQVVYAGMDVPPDTRKARATKMSEKAMREGLLLVFLKYFGEAGRFVLARELGELNKRLDNLTVADLIRLADRAQEAMMEFGEIVDIDNVRTDMKSKGYRMRDEIVGLVSEGGIA
ncbi:MAG: hypothetical protein V3V21_06885 [Thermoplasmata archaeon]